MRRKIVCGVCVLIAMLFLNCGNDSRNVSIVHKATSADSLLGSEKVSEDPNSKLFDLSATCENGKQEAYNDLMKKGLMLIDMGIATHSDEYWKVVRDKFGIHLKFRTGCTLTEGIRCYNDVMRKAIIDKFGAQIFEKLSSVADSLAQPLYDSLKAKRKNNF